MHQLGAWNLHDRVNWDAQLGEAWCARGVDDQRATVVLLPAPLQQASTMRQLSHPSLQGLLGAGVVPVWHALLEHIEGPLLRDCVRPLSQEAALRHFAALADALVALHSGGLAHGRITLSTIALSADGPCLLGAGLRGGEQADDIAALAGVVAELLPPGGARGWLGALLTSMAEPRAALRPTALQVLAALGAAGVEPPRWSAAALRRRARSIFISAPSVTAARMRWRRDGGMLLFLGGPGSGRTQLLDQIAWQCQVRGEPVVRLRWSSLPWQSIDDVLAAPGLPGPPTRLPLLSDPEERAREAARLLLQRVSNEVVIIADDCDQLDEGTLATLQVLRQEGARICASAEVAPDWARGVRLPRLSVGGLGLLTERLLGPVDPAVVDALLPVADGLPGRALLALYRAVEDGDLYRYRGRWWLRQPRLSPGRQPALPALARGVAGLLAASGRPLALSDLVALTGASQDDCAAALAALQRARLIRASGGGLRLTSRRLREQLSGDAQARESHRLLAEHLLRTGEGPVALGWHLVGAAHPGLITAHGAACILATSRRDSAAGARLADALWKIAPTQELAGPRLRSLSAAGRVDDAAAFAAGVLPDGPLGPEHVPAAVALAGFCLELQDDADAAQEVIRRAHTALRGQAVPIELLEIEAQALLKRGQPEAVLLLTAGLSAAPAGDGDEAWLTMARARAQALAATGAQAAAISLLESVGASVGRGRPVRAAVDATLGRLLWRAGRIRDAALVMERAANADCGLGALNRARLLNNAAIAWYMGGELRSALSSWESARLLFQRLGSRRDELRVQVNLCVGYRQRMAWREAREAGAAALGLAEALGEREHEAMAAGNLGDVAAAAGDGVGAEEWYARAGALAEAHGLDRERVELARRFAELALERNDSDALLRTRLAITLAQQFDHPLEVARCQAIRAVALARVGEGAAAEALLEQALSRLHDAGSEAELAIIRLWAAEAWRTLGRLQLARETAERVRSTARARGDLQLVEQSRALLDRVRAQDGLGSAGERLARLMRLSESVARQRDPRLLLGEVCQAAVEALSADSARVVLIEDSGQLFVAAARPRGRHDVPATAGAVIRTRGEVTAPASAAVPLLDGEEIIGVLCVELPPEQASGLSLGGLRMAAASAAVAVASARRLEEASLRAQLAMEFTHDIRNPIHGIKLLVELEQQEARDDPELAESLENITQLADRILVMVRTFLSDRPPQRRSVSAAELGARLHAAVHASARAAGTRLRLRCPPGLKMHADPDEIERVLVNLVDNAIRYSPLGGAVEVYADCDDGMICWRVRDHGAGIPAEVLETLFRRGTRADDTHEGYGLGLAIAERISRAHGGDVSVRNHPDGGAEFLLQLPAESGSLRER